jgi:hypothetical protein
LAARLLEIHSPVGRLRENADLISRQRVAKLASVFWHGPYSVEVVRQNDHCVDGERMMASRLAKGRAQFVYVLRQKPKPALRQIDSKEEAAPGNEVSTVVGHADKLAC